MLRLLKCKKILRNVSCPRVRRLCSRETCKSQCFGIECNSKRRSSEAFSPRFYVTSCSNDKSDKFCIDKPMKWPSGKPANFKFNEETESVLNDQINAELKAFYYYLSMAAYFGRADVALPGCESFFVQMHYEEHEHALKFLNYVKMRGGRVNLCPVLPPTDQDWKCPLHAFKPSARFLPITTSQYEEVAAFRDQSSIDLPVHEKLSLLNQKDRWKQSSTDLFGLDIEARELPSNHSIKINSAKNERRETALELEIEVSEKLVSVNTVAEKHGDLNASDFIITGFMEDQMKSVNEMGRFVAVLSGIGDQALARFMFDTDLLENHVIPKFNVLRTKSRPNGTAA